MARTDLIIGFCWMVCHLGIAICGKPPIQDSYGPPPKQETEVEIQKVEVYEVPWIGDQNPLKSQYGPPLETYGPPAQEYGPPEDSPTTVAPEQVESLNSTAQNQTEKLQQEELNEELSRGQYYIYHPTGLLQKVTYLTKDDSKNMAFSARLKYENVNPIQGPIYTYNPDTYVFSRINRK